VGRFLEKERLKTIDYIFDMMYVLTVPNKKNPYRIRKIYSVG